MIAKINEFGKNRNIRKFGLVAGAWRSLQYARFAHGSGATNESGLADGEHSNVTIWDECGRSRRGRATRKTPDPLMLSFLRFSTQNGTGPINSPRDENLDRTGGTSRRGSSREVRERLDRPDEPGN
jgi:hypothetical protein